MKKIRTVVFYGLIFSLVAMSVSCKKNTASDSELMDNEQQILKQYLQNNNITVAPTSTGLYYLSTDTSTGIRPDTADVVEFNYTLRLLNGKVLATNIDSVAKANRLTSGGVFFNPLKYRVYWWIEGMKEGFKLMHEHAKATFIVPSELAYGKNGSPSLGIGSFTTVLFDIKLIRIIHDPIAYEKAQIEKFMLDSIPGKINIEILDSGVYHLTNIAGSGDFPIDYKTVSVRYTAMLLDGTIIDRRSSKDLPISFKLNTDYVIKGIDIAVRHMKKGENAWVIIPYKQAYGERPLNYINLPPFTTLIYNLTIVDIQ